MGSVSKAQRLYFLQNNIYTKDFADLDIAPPGAEGRRYYTDGNPVTGANGNGFQIDMINYDFSIGNVQAIRYSSKGNLEYDYWSIRCYQSDTISCRGKNEAGLKLCAAFCGLDSPAAAGVYCCNDGTKLKCPTPGG